MSNIKEKPIKLEGFFDEENVSSPPNEEKDAILDGLIQDIYAKASFKDGAFQENIPNKVGMQDGETRNVDHSSGKKRIYKKIGGRMFYFDLTEVT